MPLSLNMQVETINYEIEGAAFQGKLVYSSSSGACLPGLLLAPNWLGVTDDAVRRAKEFAQRGYVVFVVDMYGTSQRPNNFTEAAPLANAIRAQPQLARTRMRRALDILEQEGMRRNLLLTGLCAAVGFCFGGGNALELARSGANIQAVVTIHGDLTTSQPAAAGDIKSAVLAIHGAADPVVPKNHRDAFEAEMSACGAVWQLLVFGNLLHAFTDVGADVPGVAKYNACACERTYALTDQFIAAAFTGQL